MDQHSAPKTPVEESLSPAQAAAPETDGRTEQSARPSGLRWGRGVYRSKDVPIRWLDRLIALLVVAIVVLTTVFAINGGYNVTFDSRGGSPVETQRLRYGKPAEEPPAPTRPGYTFAGWQIGEDPDALAWDFSVEKVVGDTTLYAAWQPAVFTVKLDPDGGTVDGQPQGTLEVTFEAPYGALPQPQKEGAVFDGWYYSGVQITPDTPVTTSGEHVLTARWH